MKRLCLLSPDLAHARKVVSALKDNGIKERHIFVIGREGMDLEDLSGTEPESSDFLAAYQRGLAFGGAGGLLAGLFALAVPGGPVIGGGALLLFGLYGAGMGALLSGLVGADFSDSRLERFRAEIEQGKLLLMVDVRAHEVDRFEKLVKSIDDTVEVFGVEPPASILP